MNQRSYPELWTSSIGFLDDSLWPPGVDRFKRPSDFAAGVRSESESDSELESDSDPDEDDEAPDPDFSDFSSLTTEVLIGWGH